jgi:hypothetical protein
MLESQHSYGVSEVRIISISSIDLILRSRAKHGVSKDGPRATPVQAATLRDGRFAASSRMR